MDRRDLDDHLDRVLIGGRQRREFLIVEYDRSWPERFARERDRIRDALGARVVRIEHIGSTSVPGLAAKPIVDVLVTVAGAGDEDAFAPPLERAGYLLRVREPAHRMFRTPDLSVNVHVWGDADPEVDRYLRFRDRLRARPHERQRYEDLKRELAQRHWDDVNYYAEGTVHRSHPRPAHRLVAAAAARSGGLELSRLPGPAGQEVTGEALRGHLLPAPALDEGLTEHLSITEHHKFARGGDLRHRLGRRATPFDSFSVGFA